MRSKRYSEGLRSLSGTVGGAGGCWNRSASKPAAGTNDGSFQTSQRSVTWKSRTASTHTCNGSVSLVAKEWPDHCGHVTAGALSGSYLAYISAEARADAARS